MTGPSIPPLIPKTVPRSDPSGTARRIRLPLPVPDLTAPRSEAPPAVYALSAVDRSGRVADRGILRALGWSPGTRLDVREQDGLITIRVAVDGVHRIDDQGHLRLPLAARRRCRLATGDRVLLAANPATGMVVAYPLPVLDELLAGPASGGDAA